MKKENEFINLHSKNKSSHDFISSSKKEDNYELVNNENYENEWQQEYRLIYYSHKLEKSVTDSASW